jgi:hypothetical protein
MKVVVGGASIRMNIQLSREILFVCATDGCGYADGNSRMKHA